MSQNTKPADPIEQYLEKYRQSHLGFAGAAAYIENACRSALSSSGILANVTSRAKDADRLGVKLRKMHEEAAFTSVADIENRIVDIIGVRVTLYFPSQINEVVAKFQSLFSDATRLDVKTAEDKPVTAKQLLQNFKLDNTMGALDTPPTQLEVQKGKYQNQYGNYRAVHVRFTLKDGDLGSVLKEQLNQCRLKTEIQIQSLLMHSWSEVSHDLSYKTLSGTLSSEENRLLDCLNGVGRLGELVLAQLKLAMDLRLKSGKEGFDSAFELAEYIRVYVDGNLAKLESPKAYVLGDVDNFLDFLKAAKKNDRNTVQGLLKRLDKQHDERQPVVDALLVKLDCVQFTFNTPFLLSEQNAKIASRTDRLEILAAVFDMAYRPILQMAPDHATNFRDTPYTDKLSQLAELGLYDKTSPAMPKTAFPVDRNALGNANVQTKIEELAGWFNKNYEKPLIRYNLYMAQIRAWTKYSNNGFLKPSVKVVSTNLPLGKK
ncbi:hypothetical protein F5B17DRAFT_403939 [Nemania serpens]|nr:hypothetical protein F5B17DRAFT_403939 [Nemania serpens]